MSKKKRESQFWTAKKAGDSVSGIFKGFTTTTYGLCLYLDTKTVSLQRVQLYNVIKNNLSALKVEKTKVKIIYVEEKEVKNRKNAVKVYQVFFDGVEMVASYEPELATKKMVDDFFQN